MASKNTICLWYDGTALEAAQFYAKTFPDTAVGAVLRAPGDYPSGMSADQTPRFLRFTKGDDPEQPGDEVTVRFLAMPIR